MRKQKLKRNNARTCARETISEDIKMLINIIDDDDDDDDGGKEVK